MYDPENPENSDKITVKKSSASGFFICLNMRFIYEGVVLLIAFWATINPAANAFDGIDCCLVTGHDISFFAT